jgi:hypothetical protein
LNGKTAQLREVILQGSGLDALNAASLVAPNDPIPPFQKPPEKRPRKTRPAAAK